MKWLLIAGFSFFISNAAEADSLNCELKTITVENGKIKKIQHEDGTVHTGNSVSDNWTFDGKSIKHRLMDERIPCDSQPKSRDEIIKKMSGRFVDNPGIYGMDKAEARWMSSYTANLMKTNKDCHLLVDAGKSTQRKNAFFVDCNDTSGNPHRFWLSKDDIRSGKQSAAVAPVSESQAIEICNAELQARTTNPSTYKPARLMGTSSRAIAATGRNVVEIDFKAKNGLGNEAKYRGRCILESGNTIDVTIEMR